MYNSWVNLDGDIDGENAQYYSEYSVAIYGDGTTMAVGDPLNDGNVNNFGNVRVYYYTGDSWGKVSDDVDG